MSRSKFEIPAAAFVLLALLVACDAVRVPVPEPPPAPIRGILTGFVVPGWPAKIRFVRPFLASERKLSPEFWIDPKVSRAGITCGEGGAALPSVSFQWSGTVSESTIGPFPEGSDCRLRGTVRWNGTTPLVAADDQFVSEDFEIHPQKSDPLRLGRAVRGTLELRWPRLARSASDSLESWAAVPESVVAFARDWGRVCSLRGSATDRFLKLDAIAHDAYRWRDPDTSDIREVMAGVALAQAVFSSGDSIWLPLGRRSAIYATLTGTTGPRGLHEVVSRLGNTSGRSSDPNSWQVGAWSTDAESGKGFVFLLSAKAAPASSSTGTRTLLSISGTCPAYENWRERGATDRSQRPSGNAAPFDGYLCLLDPDTLSFPEGDIVLTLPESVPVKSDPADKLVSQKVLP